MMRLSILSSVALFAMLTFATMPTQAGLADCIGMDVTGVGEGLGVYLDKFTNGVLVSVASGVPGEGYTMSVLVAPSMCANVLGNPPVSVGEQSKLPTIPGLP